MEIFEYTLHYLTSFIIWHNLCKTHLPTIPLPIKNFNNRAHKIQVKTASFSHCVQKDYRLRKLLLMLPRLSQPVPDFFGRIVDKLAS